MCVETVHLCMRVCGIYTCVCVNIIAVCVWEGLGLVQSYSLHILSSEMAISPRSFHAFQLFKPYLLKLQFDRVGEML